MINLGCGQRYVPDWINLDFKSSDPNVRAWDLRRGIPYPDNSFQVVYHSHVLEHFSQSDAKKFIKECYRVLSPSGIMRAVVPDLEQIARNYLQFLNEARQGDKAAETNYDWTMLELYDQAVRTRGGGEMGKYLQQRAPANLPFVKSRVGSFFDTLLATPSPTWKTNTKKILGERRVQAWRNHFSKLKSILPGYRFWAEGRFRQSGEIHQWMYDEFSLSRLLAQTGFRQIIRTTADQSQLSQWSSYHLDADADGRVYKADSLYLEGSK